MSALLRNLARRTKAKYDQDPRFAPHIRPVPLPPTGSPQYQFQAFSPPTPASPSGLGLVWVLVPATPASQSQNTPLPASPVQQPPLLPSQNQPLSVSHPAPSGRPDHAPASSSSTHATLGSATPQLSTSPVVHSSSRYRASSSGNVGPVHRTTYAPQGSRQRRASSATVPSSQPSQPPPAQQQQSSLNRVHTTSSSRATRGSPVPQPPTAMRSERTPAVPVVSTQPPSSRLQQDTTTPGLSPPVKATLDGEGAVLVDQDFSFDRTTGICSISVVSSWETVRRIAVTRPITVSDLYQVLQRATSLEYAYFECITEDSERSDIYGTEFTAKHLKSLIIACAEVPVSAIFHDLRVKRLEALQVRYAPGGGYNLWSDEVYLALFLQRAQLAKDGTICIASDETWYRDQRAAALLSSLKVAVGKAGQQWRIFVT